MALCTLAVLLPVGLLASGGAALHPALARTVAPRLQLSAKPTAALEPPCPTADECAPGPPLDELALGCLVSGIGAPELASGLVTEAPAPFEFECPNSAPIDPSTGLLPPGIELPVPVPASAPTIELPPMTLEPQRTELPALKDLAAFCLPTLGIWLSSPLLSLIDTSVVRPRKFKCAHL